MLTLFGGDPVPKATVVRGPFVYGVDAVHSLEDVQAVQALQAQLSLLTRLSEVPNTPFFGGFAFKGRWQ